MTTSSRSRNLIKANLGSGAKCRVIFNYLHPKKLLNETFINYVKKDPVVDLIALRVETKKIKGKERECIVFRHERVLENKELYACIPYVHVTTPCSPDHLFNVPNNASSNLESELNAEISVAAGDNNEILEEYQGVELPTEAVHHRSSNREDINYFRALGLDVDDDNDPVPENVPEVQSDDVNGLKPGQSWGWSGVDSRKASGYYRTNPKIINYQNEEFMCYSRFWVLHPEGFN